MEKYQMYINGDWVDSVTGKTRDVLNPYTSEALWQVPDGNEEDVDKAVNAALEAREAWADTLVTDRVNYLTGALQSLMARGERIIDILVKEGGQAISVCRMFHMASLGIITDAIQTATKFYGETIPSATGRLSITLKPPLGVVGLITAWNFPFVINLLKASPALLSGNTVILKPSIETPINALELARIFEEIGLPKGVFNVITGRGSVVGQRLVEHPNVSKISFTGSTSTGRDVAERAGRGLKKLTLELGGSDPVIVCDDADIDWASDAVVSGRFTHQGQICISSKRIILVEKIAEEFKDKLVEKTRKLKIGDPMDTKTQIGPLINKEAIRKVDEQVKGSIEQGAKLLCGGTYKNLVYEPTVMDNCTNEMPCCKEECFGPVAPIITVPDFDSAIRAANESAYGLSSGIFTKDVSMAMKAANMIQSGAVHINDSSMYFDPFAPFGGVKGSGMGKEMGGHYAFREYTNTKWITINTDRVTYPYLAFGDQ